MFDMIQRTSPPRRRRPGPPRRGRARNEAYLKWIRTLPCVCCWLISFRVSRLAEKRNRIEEFVLWFGVRSRTFEQESPTEAAHTGNHGISQKSDDNTAIPLCGTLHHREGPQSLHKLGKAFWAYWAIDRSALLDELRKRFLHQSNQN